MNRTDKQAMVGSLREAFEASPMVVISHYSGLSVAEMEKLRGTLREAGARFQVTKNTLVRLAIAGTDYEGLGALFTGPTGVTFSTDPVAAAKAATAFAKENEKFKIVGGGLGTQVLDAQSVEALSKVPSIEELRSKLLGILNAPASQFVGVTQAVPRDFMGLLQAPGLQFARTIAARQQQLAA